MDTDTPAPDVTPDTEPLHNPPDTKAADHNDAPDTDAELERWKNLSRKYEARAKANADAAKELEQIKAASMTELERAVNEARTATRAEVLREVGATRVQDQVRIAAASRLSDERVGALLEGMDPSRFMDDDGQPDVKAIAKWVDQIAPNQDTPSVPRVPFGVRDTGKSHSSPEQDFANFISNQLKPS